MKKEQVKKYENIKSHLCFPVRFERLCREEGKQYCVGQPQLRSGEFIFCNDYLRGLVSFGIGIDLFSVLVIDCQHVLNTPPPIPCPNCGYPLPNHMGACDYCGSNAC